MRALSAVPVNLLAETSRLKRLNKRISFFFYEDATRQFERTKAEFLFVCVILKIFLIAKAMHLVSTISVVLYNIQFLSIHYDIYYDRNPARIPTRNFGNPSNRLKKIFYFLHLQSAYRLYWKANSFLTRYIREEK